MMQSTDPTESSGDAAPGNSPPTARSRLLGVVETVTLTVVIFLGIQTFVAQPYKVQQVSMETTLLPDQYVLVDKVTPRWAPYARGDIIVFNAPPTFAALDGGVPLIKRIIALPGDEVELRGGLVYVNGTKLDEPYIFQDSGVPNTTDPGLGNQTTWQVPEGDLLVMGDHRERSEDSRAFGPIAISSVIGRAWLRYWPIDAFGILPKLTYGAVPDGAPTLAPSAIP